MLTITTSHTPFIIMIIVTINDYNMSVYPLRDDIPAFITSSTSKRLLAIVVLIKQ